LTTLALLSMAPGCVDAEHAMPRREALVSELGERHAVVGDPGTGVTRLSPSIASMNALSKLLEQ